MATTGTTLYSPITKLPLIHTMNRRQDPYSGDVLEIHRWLDGDSRSIFKGIQRVLIISKDVLAEGFDENRPLALRAGVGPLPAMEPPSQQEVDKECLRQLLPCARPDVVTP